LVKSFVTQRLSNSILAFSPPFSKNKEVKEGATRKLQIGINCGLLNHLGIGLKAFPSLAIHLDPEVLVSRAG
jgi:hypothetical protein